ncbi:Protein of unknown function [Bacillus cereus]|nr:Protein of unknown function [Bacillus wiedmannii]SCV19632.1 Protein of unknown function [Bacillus cereus]
MAYVIS